MKSRKNEPTWVTKPLLKRSHSSDSSIDESTVKLTNYGLFSYTRGKDLILLIVGTIAAVIHGAGFPLLAIVLGGMTTVFLRAQNSDFVVGVGNVNPNGLEPISIDEFNSEVVKYCIYYLILGVAMFVTSYVQIACFESYAENLVHKLRQNYLKAILRQQIQWFDKQQTGNLTARLTDDLERVREGLGDKFALLVQMFAAFLAGYGVGFFYSWSMTLVMMGFAPLIVLSGAKMSKSMATRTKVEQETYAVAGAIAEETFSSIRTVHSLNGHKRELDRFWNALENGRKTGIVKYCYMGIGVGFSNLCMYSSYALAFWYGSTLIINDPTFDRGLIFTVFFAVLSGSTSLGGALPHLASFGTARGAAYTVLRVINSHPKIDPYSLEGLLVDNMKGDISFQNVHFRYPSRKDIPVLKGISLEVKSGEKIALVGSSGCGKSTIVNLLQRFYDPTKGKVSIDGVDLKEINVHSLREQIGIVSQEPVLFDGTIYENIKMGNEHATHDQVVEACKMANANDFIKRLPDGYGTRVGEKGVQLSGGQKQRIAIARALVKNPKILLLDEATSALDTEAEREVQAALDQAQAGRTTLIVAHRLSTIRNVDKIFVFKAGNIVETGSHEELMNKQGVFYDMTQAQVVRQQQQEAGKDIEDTISESAHSHLSRKSSTRSAISMATSIHQLAEEVEECKAPPTPISKIFNFNRDKIWWFIGGMFGAFIFGSVTPVFALVYAEIFNVYSEPVEQMQSDVYFWCGMFVLMGITFFIGFFISANCLGRCGESLTMKLRFEAFKNLMRQDIAFYDDLRHGTGKLCTRFATDAPNVRYVFTRLPVVLASIVTILGALGIGFYYGWQLALILVVMVPLLVMGGYFEMQMRFGKQIRDTQLLEEAGKVASQAVEHIRTVHSLNRQEQFHFTYCEYLREPFNTNLKHAHTYGAVFAFSQSLIFFMYAVAFYLGSIFVNQHSMQPIDVYRVFFAISFCGQMIGNTTSFIPDVVKARLAASLLFYLIEHPTPIDSLSEAGIVKPITGNISIRNIFFNYPTRKETKVLQGFTIDIKPGQTVALVGHSGCGKSTIMGLLERFYNQDKGMIMIDGDNIRNLNISSLRQQVCIVSQEPTLFDCTIGENICYGTNRNVTYQEIVEAAKMANIHNFILGLPDGYDTHVGEKGTQLSGGQKQRIAIARALVRSPSVLLLDEATSALDTESEKIVQEALDAAKQGRTCLVIAHRLSTIQNSDVIAIPPPLENVPPIMHQPRDRRNKDTTRSVMQTVEEPPSNQFKRNTNMLPPKTQMLPVNPSQNQYPIPPPAHSPMNNFQQNNYPKELPAKTMMLPPTPMVPIQAAPQSPARTQMVSVTPMANSTRPSQGFNPYNPPPPLPTPMTPMQQPPQQPPSPYARTPKNTNASVGTLMPVAQLPAITASTPSNLPPPPPTAPAPVYQPSAELFKKSKEKGGTIDEAEASEKAKRKEMINNWIRQVLTNGIEGLKKEYKDAPNGGTIEQAQVFHNNPTRNRYTNIPCCDATRVKLDGDPNFYIHANVVSSAQNRRFICAQAPLAGTVEEFWKMIIFSGLELIVMLCEFVETGKQKSAVYFPAKVGASMKIGKLCTVTKISSESLDKTLTMSTLRITKKDKQDATLTVKHIHWHNWPDHGVPDNFISPLRLLNLYRASPKPIIVHCSAGVGRTGTLVLIFIILESFSLPDFAGVPRLLAKLREERFKSIQTEMQYLYVHRCVLEYLVYKKYQHSKEDYAKFVKHYKAAEKTAA
ncbi:hypothetical protein L3Y34_014663 [Caenorhabditis briggsae]|uniref:ABC-type xenobiotic transporter n=1 Tax=Caenorhabditis briggsae TaxID=6238 RepID=A0AAE9IYE6_CAEBR|nr:hypothetical protein L3Y34_014663 [Caenorhabditis briggsae]